MVYDQNNAGLIEQSNRIVDETIRAGIRKQNSHNIVESQHLAFFVLPASTVRIVLILSHTVIFMTVFTHSCGVFFEILETLPSSTLSIGLTIE